ncbi:DNA methyltransferase [Bacillus sp. FSL R9-9481]|uniref:DNA methyltransferase n=1 Tax=Bacillus sp. FSL R9-9481 TaxID=2921591 RepID=UPI0030FB262A
MHQIELFEEKENYITKATDDEIEVKQFSHNEFCDQAERLKLEKKYIGIVDETDIFNRKLVSYQANKNQSIHQWIKYREGFSSELVQTLIEEFNLQSGDTLLEPFLGSGTTSLTAKMLGINCVGMDILPHAHLSFEAKNNIFDYDINELQSIYNTLFELTPDTENVEPFPHIAITDTAFSEQTEKELMFYTKWIETAEISQESKTLLKLILTSILEEISYTRKDGQYLKWDSRAEKIIKNNEKRISQGKEPVKGLNKGDLPTVKESMLNGFLVILNDIRDIQENPPKIESEQRLIKDSVLKALPTLKTNGFNGVITSPPYCNRYDYTRTYALELAYLSIGEKGIKALRQDQLSCTVENKSKVEQLKEYYSSLGLEARFNQIEKIINENKVLKEIIDALKKRNEVGEINNKGVLRMVEGYFTELTFTYFEIFRTCKSGSKVAFVNDNVRYAGEVIPVDFLSTYIAEQIGFKPIKIYTLKQKKGNSSQQMKKYGRVPLRKSITIWEKP